MAKRVPTDLQILKAIYDNYYDVFCAYDNDQSIRDTKIFVPIDCREVAEKLGTNGDIVFGRLYYHLANKYKYTDHGDGKKTVVKLFEFQVGKDSKCIHFPFMTSVLADLTIEDRRFRLTLAASIIALCVSMFSLSATVYEQFAPEVQQHQPKMNFKQTLQPSANTLSE